MTDRRETAIPVRSNEFGFRRRCGWCGVELRGWQLNLCRTCRADVKSDRPSPTFRHLSRVEDWADGKGPQNGRNDD